MMLLIVTYMMSMMIIMMMLMFILMYSLNMFIMIDMKMSYLNYMVINWSLFMDKKSFIFTMAVMIITLNILMFASMYMMYDMDTSQFYKILMLFMLSMLILINSGDMMSLFMGWDGLGMSSFMLVAFYYNSKSMSGSIITLLTNRVGDATLLMSISLMLLNNHMNITKMSNINNLSLLLLILSVMTKSAQMPFTVWLPEAMSAPTPVSALVHSSTLVTAGLYLLMRYYNSLINNYFSIMLMYLAMWTSMMGSLMGIATKDSKKIVAISTLSQLGLMMTSLSLGMLELTFFHLITHAMFKALLFMTIGVEIMYKSHTQSLSMKNMRKSNFMVSYSKMISLLTLNAIFFTSGYFSKDSILEFIQTTEKLEPMLMLYLSTSLTTLYSLRLWKSKMSSKYSYSLVSGKMNQVQMCYLVMSFMSIITGSMLSFIMWPIYITPDTNLEHNTPIMIMILGMIMFMNINKLKLKEMKNLTKNMFIMKIMTKNTYNIILKHTYKMIYMTEVSLMEMILPLYSSYLSKKLSDWSIEMQLNSLPTYLTWSFMMVIMMKMLM